MNTTTQLPLFDLDAGRAARDAGMASAARHADRDPAVWSAEGAYAALVQLASKQPYIHTDDLAREYPPTCPRPNALGHVWMRAIKAGVIQRTAGSRPSKQPGKHAHEYRIYESGLYRAPSHQVGQEREQRSA